MMRWWPFSRRRQLDRALVIRPPVLKFPGFDPELRQATEFRRLRAEQIRLQAAKIDSGTPEPEKLRLVR